MRSQIPVLLFFTFLLLGCATLKTTKPLATADFKEHSWKMVYIEDEDPDTGKFVQEIWILNDSKLIDSLRNEYSCDLNKQGDGDKEYQIYLFKDNKNYDWVCFNNKKNFRLGNLKSKLIPTTTSYYYFPNLHTTKAFADSLDQLNVIYTISPIGKEKQETDEYTLKIKLCMNPESKLLKGKNPGFYDCKTYTKEELARLYPEQNGANYSFCEPLSEWCAGAPGDISNGGSENFANMRNEQTIITSSKTFDVTRLNTTDLFSRYEICTLYTITIYTKK